MRLLGFAFVVMMPVIAASPRAIADAGRGSTNLPRHEIAGFNTPVSTAEITSTAIAESAPGAATAAQPESAKPAVAEPSASPSSGLLKSARRPAIRAVTRTANGLPGPLGRATGSGTPEPSSLLLLGFGLLGLAFVVFRKAKSSDVVAQE
jgi:hypothetical protein